MITNMSLRSRLPTKLGQRVLKAAGPGVVTGAADDDPSGIATYSIAGAQHGTQLLWTAFVTWPLMAFVQMMCARIGMVTGMGLAQALERKFSRRLVIIASLMLLVANTINIGSDLAGMSEALEVLTGAPAALFVAPLGFAIMWGTVVLRFNQIERVLKWLVGVLFVYVITAFLVPIDWSEVLRATVVPSIPRGVDAWATLVALLGTTISPYLFFWQTGEEVEENRARGRIEAATRHPISPVTITDRAIDVTLGTFFSNVVMYFIILTTAMTLHPAGITNIESSKDAALALRPLAGELASTLYAIGILGVGILAIPTLAGSAAYALTETFRWTEGLDLKFRQAPQFYTIMMVATGIGALLNLLDINPMQALFWTAVMNGVLAPFLLLGILAITTDKTIMRGQTSSPISVAVVGLTTTLMFAAAIGMFVLSSW
jgi:NRAMP (natural resistance-associated macrophage protein)-like metal ion transporter